MIIFIDGKQMEVKEADVNKVCEGFNKRIIRILYLKDDVKNNKINEQDLSTYIKSLMMDVYGAYLLFDNYKFLNCLCELTSIESHIWDTNIRKKILDVANYINTIVNKEVVRDGNR